MALSNILLLSQIAGYVIAFILSLCIVVPMSLHQDDFKGHCLLFSTGEWLEADGQLKVNWASQCYCNYTIFVGVMLCLVSIIQIYRLSVFLYKGTDSSFLSAFIDVLSGILLCGMTIIAALMITFGFMAWCQNMTERFPSCELAAGQDIDRADEINTKHFYIQLGTAQFGVWGSFTTWVGLSVCALLKLCRCELAAGQNINRADEINPSHSYIQLRTAQFGVCWSFTTWVGLSVCALLKLCRYHQLENIIRVSMYRERQRLIKEDADSPGGSLGRESNNTQSTATAE